MRKSNIQYGINTPNALAFFHAVSCITAVKQTLCALHFQDSIALRNCANCHGMITSASSRKWIIGVDWLRLNRGRRALVVAAHISAVVLALGVRHP